MALPMDEQRILEEMEQVLAAEDPRLAARLASFGRPGIGYALRTRRARAALLLMTLVVVLAAILVIYALSAVRLGNGNSPRHPQHGARPASAHTSGTATYNGIRVNGRSGGNGAAP